MIQTAFGIGTWDLGPGTSGSWVWTHRHQYIIIDRIKEMLQRLMIDDAVAVCPLSSSVEPPNDAREETRRKMPLVTHRLRPTDVTMGGEGGGGGGWDN